MSRVGALVARLCIVAISVVAPGPGRSADGEQVRIAASDRYGAGRVHRFAFGGGYRDLWEAEIELPLLNLQTEGGGLAPTRRFGGLQTAVLGFSGRDGRIYTFRGTDKDPSNVLDPLLRDTVVQTVVQDQMAAQHPGGPLAAAVISEAAGVHTVHPRMLVMPDDPALGEFRGEFAGMVGTFYEFPTPASETHEGFAGATEIIGYEELYERLEAGHDDAVDVEAFLRARLLDLLLGDFDRHRKQWRWARLPGDPRWQPIPEDRDMAFVRYDGFGLRLTYLYVPILQNYGPEYPWIKGLTLHGWEQDRWLLPRLSWSDWERVARDLKGRISDAVIDEAVAALPAEYIALDGDRLRRDVRGRRDRLVEGARSFYDHLAREVDLRLSDAGEEVVVTRATDGSMQVEVRRRDAGEPLLRRSFEACETGEVRLYLRGGADVVTVKGEPGPIRLRVIADAGDKTVDDTAGGGTRIYDANGTVSVRAGKGTDVERRPYEPPPSDAGFVDIEGVPPRDWGSDIVPFPELGFDDDVGVFLGLGATYKRYGFRKDPWSSKHRLSVGWATEAIRPRVNYVGLFRPENSKWLAELELQYSGIEVLRFFGFGNGTSDNGDGSDNLFRVRNEQFRVAPSLSAPLFDDRFRVAAGPWLSYSRTADKNRLIDILDPYGNGEFGSIGAFASLQFDTREAPRDNANLALPFHRNPAAGYPTSGVFFEFTGQVSPPVWDVEQTWGSVEGSLAGFVSAFANDRATLGVRVGGKTTFGRTPYYAAAYLGGGEFFSGSAAVRGYRAQRFAGDSSVFANADLRIFLIRFKLVVPGDFGVLGFGDVGRVFVDDESSGGWHPSWGGGVWFSPLARTNTVSLSVAGSPEGTLVYLRFGFHY